jgi:hypothetical protein
MAARNEGLLPGAKPRHESEERALITGIAGQDRFCPKTRAKFCWKARTGLQDPVLEMVPADCAGTGVVFPLHSAVEAR